LGKLTRISLNNKATPSVAKRSPKKYFAEFFDAKFLIIFIAGLFSDLGFIRDYPPI
jgi:hypothetical protein